MPEQKALFSRILNIESRELLFSFEQYVVERYITILLLWEIRHPLAGDTSIFLILIFRATIEQPDIFGCVTRMALRPPQRWSLMPGLVKMYTPRVLPANFERDHPPAWR